MFQVTDPHYHIKSSKHGPKGLLWQWFCVQSGYNHYMAMIPSPAPHVHAFLCGLLISFALMGDDFNSSVAFTRKYDYRDKQRFAFRDR
jgi:hypothetical protein